MSTDVIESPLRGETALRVAREVRSQFRFGFDGHDRKVVPLPPGNATRLTEQLASTVERSLLQIVPLGAQSEVASSFTDAVWRSVATDARRQVAVRRLYLVPPGYPRPLPDENEAVRRSGGRLQVRSLALRDLGNDKLAIPVTNLWLVDDAAVVSEVPDGQSRWQVSARPIDIERFLDTWHELWDRASRPHGDDRDSMVEPLLRSADDMATVARMTCKKPLYGQATCEWFHAVWQYLRVFDMVSSPDWHRAFFMKALESEFRAFSSAHPRRRPRVLITGAADYSMLAYVLAAADRSHSALDVGILDRCRTPLVACEWYSRYREEHEEQSLDHTIRVHEADVLTLRNPRSLRYDVITTDDYLTRFEPAQAEKVAAIWHQLLKPGGTVISTARIHPMDAPRGALLDEVSDFALRAQSAAERWRMYLKAGVEELTVAARQYAVSMRSYDLGDENDIVALLGEVGFDVEHRELGATPGELRESTYVRFIAKKANAADS